MTRPSPRLSLVEELTTALSREIMAGSFDPARRLPTEPELSARFAVSRTVVREATKQLESRGLVEIERGRGVRIVNQLHKPVSRSVELRLPNLRDRLEKLLEARRELEPAVARLAAKRAKPAQLRQLREVHARMSAATEVNAVTELDLEFHRLLTRAAGNEVFELMLESVAELGRESRRATNAEARWADAISGHAEILAALEIGDGDQAAEAMVRHMEFAAVNLRRYFAGRSAKA